MTQKSDREKCVCGGGGGGGGEGGGGRERAELWNTNSEAKLLVCLEEVKTNMIRIKNL